MSAVLSVLSVGPAVTVQDLGRPGYLAQGMSQGGAMDTLALHEAAALLGRDVADLASIEMGGFGGRFRFEGTARVALNGAPMRATLDGDTLRWNAVHAVEPGSTLELGPCLRGQYGYLSIGGALDVPKVMGSRTVHTRAGLGHVLAAGDQIGIGEDPAPARHGLCLPENPRFEGGTLSVLASAQTALYPAEMLKQFEATEFRRAARGSRLGVVLEGPENGFGLPGSLSLLSEITQHGDIQITGDGTPFLLLADCQTTGGYPRIACVLPQDLPKAAQAAPGTPLRFRFSTPDSALAQYRVWLKALSSLALRCSPVIRHPSQVRDLLTKQLISGVTNGA